MIQKQPSSRLQRMLLSSFNIITTTARLFHFMPNSCSQSLLSRARCSECSVERFQHAWAPDSQVCSNHEVLTQVYVLSHTHTQNALTRQPAIFLSLHLSTLFTIRTSAGYYSQAVFLLSAILHRSNIIQPSSHLWWGGAYTKSVWGVEIEWALSHAAACAGSAWIC